MTRDRIALLADVLERIGVMTRAFSARGTYPFSSRGLSRTQMNLLFVLSRTGGASVAHLARSLGVTSGAVSQTIDALKASGVITSEVNPADRRGRIIRLTDVARREVEEFERDYFDAISPSFAALSMPEIVELDRILSKVRSNE